jgi:stage V sporulation protein G
MEITEVKVFPIDEEKLKAFVSVVFDHCFMVNDIKIIQGRDGLFISMPSRKKKNGEFKDVAHPLNNETRRTIEGSVLGEYQRVLGERGEQLPAPPRTQPVARPAAVAAPPVVEPPAPPLAPPPVAPEPVAPPASFAGDGHDGAGAGLAAAPAPAAAVAAEDAEDKSLEEIQELHLRDSFWSVP